MRISLLRERSTYKGSDVTQDGLLTPYISAMVPGQSELLFKGPIPKFKYEPNQIDRGLCVSGGSGITPMYQLISYSLSLPDDKTKWTLLFSNVTEQDIRELRSIPVVL